MKSTISRLVLFVVIMIGMASCFNKGQISLPPCTGKPGEVVLVLHDDYFDGAIGDSLVRILTKDEPGLPQTGMEGAEPMFDLVRIPPSAFSNLIRPARNLILTEIGPEVTKPEIAGFKDYWAADQILLRMHAPDRESFLKLVDDNRDYIVKTLREGEVDRQMTYNYKYQNVDLANQIARRHQIQTSFPKGFEALVDTGNFIWVQFDPPESTLGLLVWYYPYVDESQVEYSRLIAATDKHLKPRVPGPSKGSYMAIDMNSLIHTRTFDQNGSFVRELRGLWETEGDFMGGPFISWSFVDEKRNRIVTAFGFVYAPKMNKRNHIRRMESLLKTISFPDLPDNQIAGSAASE